MSPLGDNFSKDPSNIATTSQYSTSTTLWDSWQLNKDFFTSLTQWTLDHPETTLDRVLENVCSAVDTGKSYFDVIPDSPFPARSLVLGLAHLIDLGRIMSSAKLEVRTFAREIIGWVSDMKSSLASARGGHVTEDIWRNMARMRDLIDEICTWAAMRLGEGRWSLSNLKIRKEIAEFKRRFAEAREIFQDRSFISISGGIDAIAQMILALMGHLGAMMLLLQKIWVMLVRWEATEARKTYLKDTLYPHTVADPTYVQQGKAPCDEDTRVEVLTLIRDWIDDVSEGSQNFLWLTGKPGCGKSAITATIAQSCKDLNELWAQFFINRNNADTTNPNSYFPSIARQLALRSTVVERRVYDALKQQPSILDGVTPQQAAKLFVDAVGAASMTDRERPILIVIDGLDETARAHLKVTATIFSNLFNALLEYPNVKVLISSRTEDEIWKPFIEMMKVDYVKHIHLDTSEPSSIRDVSVYLTKRVEQIAQDNDLNPEEWFGKESLAKLTLRASGLFIWAVTVEKLLQSHMEQLGKEGLRSVLQRLDSDKMKDINTLYGSILELTYDKDVDAWRLEIFRRVVGAILVLREPLGVAHIESLLNLRQHPRSDPVDVQKLVRRLRTVLVAGTDKVDHTTVPQLHKSFVDFITGRSADSRFRINLEVSNSEVAVQCLDHLTNAYHAIHAAQIPSMSLHKVSLSVHLRYALRFYASHLRQEGTSVGIIISSEDPSRTIKLPELHTILQRSFNEEGLGPLRISISHDQSQIFTSLDNDTDVWDAGNGYLIATGTPIAILEGHRHGVTSVSISPDGSQIVSGSWDNTACFWDAYTYKPIGSPLAGHTDAVYSVCFSPDGKLIASGSWDKTIRIWDTKNGEGVGLPLVHHSSRVNSVTFSPDGRYIISGSDDKTVCVWDVQLCQLFGIPLHGHTGWVRSVASSPNGSQIVSGSKDSTIRLWNFFTGQPHGLPLEGHKGSTCVAISPNLSYIVSGSFDCAIRLWEAGTGKPAQTPWLGHTRPVRSVAFSPNGCYVVSGSLDNTVRLWDVQSGQVVTTFTGHQGGVRSVVFSPDGKRIISGSEDQTIRIWRIPFNFLDHKFQAAFTAFSPSGQLILSCDSDHVMRLWGVGRDKTKGLTLEGEGADIRSIVFSANELRIAGASHDGIIYLWDAKTQSLLGHSPLWSISSTESLFFTSDGESIVAKNTDSKSPGMVWTMVDGRLINTSEVSQLLQIHDSTYFDVTQTAHTYQGTNNSHPQTIQWYPRRESDTGFWGYINNHIIRGQDDNSVVVLPVSRGNVMK